MHPVELAQTVKTQGLQNHVRQTMKSCRTFTIDAQIPDDLLRKLERLDEVTKTKA